MLSAISSTAGSANYRREPSQELEKELAANCVNYRSPFASLAQLAALSRRPAGQWNFI